MTSLIAVGGSGAIQGGWEYIIPAFVLPWIFFVGYAVYVRRLAQAFEDPQ